MADTLYLFNPSVMEREILERIFVGEERKRLLERLRRDILKGARINSPRYYLVIGPRGIGKSHFVTLLYYRLLEHLDEVLPVKLAEEEYSIFTLADFLVRVLQAMGKYEVVSKLEDRTEEEIIELAKEFLKETRKMIVVVLENLNQIIEEQMTEEEVKKFRSFLQETNFMSIVSTAPSIFPGVSKHSAPFFNFFRVIHLHEMRRDEVWELLRKLAEIEGDSELIRRINESRGSVNAVIRITGGNPRAVVLIYNVLKSGEIVSAENLLFKILDESTPYYQSIYSMLDGRKRKVLDTLIMIGRPATPKEIARKARMDERSVATYLRRLERDGYILSKRAGKNTYYSVRDVLFKLWRELRINPSRKGMVSLFIEFLQVWYTPEEIIEKLSNLLEEKELDKKRAKEIAYLFFSLPKDYKMRIVEPVTRKLLEAGFVELIEENLSDMEVKEQALFVEFTELMKNGEYEKVLKKASRYIERDEKSPIPWMFKAAALDELGREKEAEQVLKDAINMFRDSWLVLATLGFFYLEKEKLSEAISLSERVIGMAPELPVGWALKGEALMAVGRYSEALEALNRAISLAANIENAELYLDRARCYLNLGKFEKAAEDAQRALNTEPDHPSAIRILALSLIELERYEEAIPLLDQYLQKHPEDWSTWRIKLGSLGLIGKGEDAINTANEIVKRYPLITDAWLVRLDIYLGATMEALIEGNFGSARNYLSTTVETINRVLTLDPTRTKEIVSAISGFLRNVVEYCDMNALKLSLEYLRGVKNLKEILEPFEVAINVLETGNERAYLKLNPESRKIAEEIVKKMKEQKTSGETVRKLGTQK